MGENSPLPPPMLQTCQKVSWIVPKWPKMSKNVWKCPIQTHPCPNGLVCFQTGFAFWRPERHLGPTPKESKILPTVLPMWAHWFLLSETEFTRSPTTYLVLVISKYIPICKWWMDDFVKLLVALVEVAGWSGRRHPIRPSFPNLLSSLFFCPNLSKQTSFANEKNNIGNEWKILFG